MYTRQERVSICTEFQETKLVYTYMLTRDDLESISKGLSDPVSDPDLVVIRTQHTCQVASAEAKNPPILLGDITLQGRVLFLFFGPFRPVASYIQTDIMK